MADSCKDDIKKDRSQYVGHQSPGTGIREENNDMKLENEKRRNGLEKEKSPIRLMEPATTGNQRKRIPIVVKLSGRNKIRSAVSAQMRKYRGASQLHQISTDKSKEKKSRLSRSSILLAIVLGIVALVGCVYLYMRIIQVEHDLSSINRALTDKSEVIKQSLIKDCYYAVPWHDTHGIMIIYPEVYPKGIKVYCDQHTDAGGWTVIQRRIDGSVNFYRSWYYYERGFGTPEEEFWMGLQTIHTLMENKSYELLIDLEDFEGNKVYAKYDSFRIGDADSQYTLYIDGYSGTANDSLRYQNHMKFSTFDSDNDKAEHNCAVVHKGAWWYNRCHSSNLNGRYFRGGKHKKYASGINWRLWKGDYYSLKSTEMKIRLKI